MIWQGWLFIGLVGVLFTYIALTTSQDDVLILSGLVGMFTWALFAFMSLYVVVVSQGTEFSYNYAAVSVWGAGLGVINAYAVLEGPIVLIDQRTRATEDVTK